MKRLIFALLVCLMLGLSITACGETEEGAIDPSFEEDRFIQTEYCSQSGYFDYVVIDKETRVQYLVVYSSQCSGITPLIDAEGKPILYEGNIP